MLYGIVLALLLSVPPSLGYQGAGVPSIERTSFLPDFFLDPFEYTFEVNGTEIFPNETVKRQITENYTESQYNTTMLEYDIMDYHVNASNATIHVDPSRIDDAKTRLDLQIYAEDVRVSGGANSHYDRVDLESLYGIYDKETDKITMHVPLGVALSYIGKLTG